MKEQEQRMKSREEDKKRIEDRGEHAVDYWGYPCLKNATKLQWDIGTFVYYAFAGEVFKGMVSSVRPSGMHSVKIIGNDDVIISLNGNEIYTNVFYALRDAEQQVIDRKNPLESEEEKTAECSCDPENGACDACPPEKRARHKAALKPEDD